MSLLRKWMLLPLLLPIAACQTSGKDLRPDLEAIIEEAVCANLVPIVGKSTDDPLTRRQVKRQNGRVLACPPELQREPDLS
jgi:hypothetical protein